MILMVLDSGKAEHSDKNNVDETNGVTNSQKSMQADTDGEGERPMNNALPQIYIIELPSVLTTALDQDLKLINLPFGPDRNINSYMRYLLFNLIRICILHAVGVSGSTCYLSGGCIR